MIEFNFSEDLILENEIVQLRLLQQSDVEFLLPFALNEPEIWNYSLIDASSKEKLEGYIEQALNERKLRKSLPFLVIDKRTNEVAGTSRYYDMNLSSKSLSLGYTWYGKKFQGTGLNKQCKFLLLQFAFETLGAERVEFRADNDNKRSIAAMKSIGCMEEGVLRSNLERPDGTRRDSIVLSILKNEWNNSVKEKLFAKLRS